LYRVGLRWQRPARDMRILVAAGDIEAVGFNVPVAELLTARELSRHVQLSTLGPDLLDPAFDRAEALPRIRAPRDQAIGDVLLNQRVLAGIGNVFKSEILFLAGIAPFTPVAQLSDREVEQIVQIAHHQLASNVMTRAHGLSVPTGRRTTRSLDPNKAL